MIRTRALAAGLLSSLLCGAMSAPLPAQTAGPQDTEQAPPAPLATSPVYVPPHYRFQQRAVYPVGEKNQGGEGWALLTCMVDVTGKPHDIAVTRSSGGKAFETAAQMALEASTFEPATLDGKPVEGRFTRQFRFFVSSDRLRHNSTGTSAPDVHRGASSQFTEAYAVFQKALKENNRAGADSALQGMHVINEYESATYGLATYQYAVLWGDQRQQLTAIRRAVSIDNEAQDLSYSERHFVGGGTHILNIEFEHYLPIDVWKTGLLTCLNLELKTHEYSEALETWRRVQTVGIKPEILEKLKPVMEQLSALRTDSRSFDVNGVLADNGWSLDLFKTRFRIVTAGKIDQVHLRCDRGSLSFKYDPEQEYKVNGTDGKCQIQLTGTAGTAFTLTQF